MQKMIQMFKVSCLSVITAVLLLHIDILELHAETSDKAFEIHDVAEYRKMLKIDEAIVRDPLASAAEILEKLESVESIDSQLHAETFDKALKFHDIAGYRKRLQIDETTARDALASAIEILERLKTVEPIDPRVIALLGSCYAIAARDLNSLNVFKRRSDIKKGLEYIDRALEMNSDDIVVRLIRTAVQFHVPETRLVSSTIGRNQAALDEMLILDELFKKEKLAAIAAHMYILYEKMREKLPDSDWSIGTKIAQNLAQ